MSDEEERTRRTGAPIGLCRLYGVASEMLALAAEVARRHPVGSLKRRKTIDDAISETKRRFPQYFRNGSGR
jgi:hypothetical protein